MKLMLTLRDGTVVHVTPVRSIEVVGPNCLKTATYGNEPVVHRDVVEADVRFVGAHEEIKDGNERQLNEMVQFERKMAGWPAEEVFDALTGHGRF